MKFKINAVYFAVTIFILAIGILIYSQLGTAQKTIPKVKLSYFENTDLFADAVLGRLQQETAGEKSFWFGIEPEKNNHIQLALSLKNKIEKQNGKFDAVFIDKELNIDTKIFTELQNAEVVLVRDEWPNVADKIKALDGKKYFLITAAIYSTSFLKQNPLAKIAEKNQSRPMTFSSGYFSSDVHDEDGGVFRCSTEDKEGVSGWGCAVVNKSRSQRKKLNVEKKSLAGLMDLTGEKDYMILLR